MARDGKHPGRYVETGHEGALARGEHGQRAGAAADVEDRHPRRDAGAVEEQLKEMLEKHRGQLDELKFDPSKNEEYDEEFAKIGRHDEDKAEEDDQ